MKSKGSRFDLFLGGNLLLSEGLVTLVQLRPLECREEQLGGGTVVHVGPEHHYGHLLLSEYV